MTIDLETLHLAKGAHPDCGDGHGPVCLMEAVACFASNPFSDHPETTSPVLAAFGRAINDAMPDARRQDLKQFIPRLVATSDQAERDVQRGFLLADWSVRTILPMSLESACAALSAKAEKLRTAGRMTTADEFGAHVAKLAAAAETLRALAPLTSRVEAWAAWAAWAAARAEAWAAWAATRAATRAAEAATRAATEARAAEAAEAQGAARAAEAAEAWAAAAVAQGAARAARVAAGARVAAEAEAAAAADPVWDECIRFFGDLIDCGPVA